MTECIAKASLKIEWLNVTVQIPTATTFVRAGSIQHVNMLDPCARKVALHAGHPVALASLGVTHTKGSENHDMGPH